MSKNIKKLSKKHCKALEAAARIAQRAWLREGEICQDFLLSMHDSINYTFNIRDLNKLEKNLKRYCLEIRNYYFNNENQSSSKNIKDDYLLGDALFDELKGSREMKNLRDLHVLENKHTRQMKVEQFLSEFVELQPLIDEITKDSEWVSIHHNYSIYINWLSLEKGSISYRHGYDNKERWPYLINIENFKDIFRSVKEVT